MQRGSSATWHPRLESALSIPPWSEGLHRIVDAHHLDGASEGYVREYLHRNPRVLKGTGATPDDLVALIQELATQDGSDDRSPTTPAGLRLDEYKQLCAGKPETHSAAHQSFVCEAPDQAGAYLLTPWHIDQSMLVKRLREVRVLRSFTRGELPGDGDPDERFAPLTLDHTLDWLPAVEVIGEGVFLRLSPDRLSAWEQRSEVRERAERVRESHRQQLVERLGRSGATGRTDVESPVTARLLLVHTLAHVLLDEWSLDGGYPASALRERLYVDDTMAGVLIYTATSDSAGSLGGLVAQGAPDRLRDSLRSALARAAWCSNDPLCGEAVAGGSDSVNLAACHSCVLLPETSCEHLNGFLDRAMLVGTPDETVPGFFPQVT